MEAEGSEATGSRNPRPARLLAVAAVILGLAAFPLLLDPAAPEPGFGPASGRGFLLAVAALILALVALFSGHRSQATRLIPVAGLVLACCSFLMFCAGFQMWRHRIAARESAAIGAVRELIRAERAYASAAGGAYASLDCLASRGECLPGAEVPVFQHRDEAMGYRRSFYAGPEAPSVGTSRPGLRTFAYVAVPMRPGFTGIRAFCGDDTGEIRYAENAGRPPARWLLGGVVTRHCRSSLSAGLGLLIRMNRGSSRREAYRGSHPSAKTKSAPTEDRARKMIPVATIQ